MFALAGVTGQWTHFVSKTYPYTISRPSSFRPASVVEASGLKVDYFFPPIGSFTTNVNVCSYLGTRAPNEAAYLRSLGGRNVHRSMRLYLAGRWRPFYAAHFAGPVGGWTLEQTSFVARSRVWRLTASFADQHRSMRSILVQMLRSFRLH